MTDIEEVRAMREEWLNKKAEAEEKQTEADDVQGEANDLWDEADELASAVSEALDEFEDEEVAELREEIESED